MTDGPLRSLALPRPWKSVADCVCREGTISEVARRMEYAVLRLADARVIGIVSDILKTIPESLFADRAMQVVTRLDALRTTDASPFANTVIEAAQAVALDGFCGEEACDRTLELTFQDIATSSSRAVGEHWQRKAGLSDGRAMARILAEARSKLSFSTIRSLVGRSAKDQRRMLGLAKKEGIDEGPPI